jgi:hypothetical protein
MCSVAMDKRSRYGDADPWRTLRALVGVTKITVQQIHLAPNL